MVASVEVRPRGSIAPVLKKVFVELLTVTQPLGLRRREPWLLPVESLSDRRWSDCSSPVNCAYDNASTGRPKKYSNPRSNDRHDRLHPRRCDLRLGR